MKVNLKERTKGKNGITLIALVITIVVLLILAGVSIAALIGDNGILTKAKSAKENSTQKTVEEQVNLAVQASKINEEVVIDKGILEQELTNSGMKITKSENDKLPWTVKKDGYVYTISENGEVKEKVGTLVSVTAQQIAANPKAYYGKKVENYKASEEDTNTYRIFYVDTENNFKDGNYTIYLKADDSNAYSNKIYNLNDYELYDKANTKIRTMNPLWSAQRTVESSWNENEKAAAYLCSPVNSTTYEATTLPWKSYYKPNDENVNYVIGGPSIEMYVKSYNQTHDKDINGNDALECQYQTNSTPGYGYKVFGVTQNNGWYTNENTLDYSNTYISMYCGKNGAKEGDWWLSSPSAKSSYYVCDVYSGRAFLDNRQYNNDIGLCPLVSLKSSFQVQIEQ